MTTVSGRRCGYFLPLGTTKTLLRSINRPSASANDLHHPAVLKFLFSAASNNLLFIQRELLLIPFCEIATSGALPRLVVAIVL
jgi:hypothetical protein